MRGVLAVLLFVFAGHLSVGFRVARRDGSAEAEGGGRRREGRRRRSPRRRGSPSAPRRRGDSSPSPQRRRGDSSPSPTPPPPAGDCLEFLLIGDWGMGNSGQSANAKGLGKVASEKKPAAVMALGDNIYGSISHSKFKKLFVEYYIDPHKSLRVPWYGMNGNHEWYEGSDAKKMVSFTKSSENKDGHWRMPDLWYKVSFKTSKGVTIDFFLIDSMLFKKDKAATKYAKFSDQYDWLKSALGNSTADWKLVFGHHPAYQWDKKKKKVGSSGSYKKNGMEKLLLQNGVPMFIAGHFHHMELSQHSSGIWAMVSGGGGQNYNSKQESAKNGLKAWYDKGGFFGATFCDSSTFEVSIYKPNGDHRFSHTIPNSRKSRGSSSALAMREQPEDDGDEEYPVCKGVELGLVDRTCSADGCTVAVDGPWWSTCRSFCEKRGLSCEGGWRQGNEEDCTPVEDLGCNRTVQSQNTHMCQCA